MPTERIEGVDLYYETGGTGPPVLMISGMANTVEWFRPSFERLADAFTYVSFDYPGVGRSGPTDRYEVTDLADLSFALMEQLGHERFFVVGLSMGGMVTQEMLVRRTDRIERAILLSSGRASLPDHLKAQAEDPASADNAIIAAQSMEIADRIRATAPSVFSPQFIEDTERFEAWLAWQVPLAAPADVLAGYIGSAMRVDAGDRLHLVDVPTMVVAGTADALINQFGVAPTVELAAQIPGAQVLQLPGGSHGIAIEYPGWTASVIRYFFTADLDHYPERSRADRAAATV